MRKESVLPLDHPVVKDDGKNICLFNIRSWKLHLEYFASDKFLVANSGVLCFTETKTRNCNEVKNIGDYCDGWEAIHYRSEHGLAVCYNTATNQCS